MADGSRIPRGIDGFNLYIRQSSESGEEGYPTTLNLFFQLFHIPYHSKISAFSKSVPNRSVSKSSTAPLTKNLVFSV